MTISSAEETDPGTPSPDSPQTAAAHLEARLVEGPVGKTLWNLSWPMTMGLFSVIAFNIVDTFYIGMLGPDQLAAIGYCFPVIFMMGSAAVGLGVGSVSVVSRAMGEGNMPRARRLTANAMMLVVIYSVILTGIMYAISDEVFALLGAPPEIMPYIDQYMDVWYAGLVFLVSPIVAHNLIRANGAALASSLFMVLAAVVNAILSPFFIFGLAGLPELGMSGAALATIISRGAAAAAGIWYLIYREQVMEVSWRSVKALPRHIRSILTFAIPAALAKISQPLGTAVIVRLLSEYGNDAVAGFTVGSRIETLLLIPFLAFQVGISPFIGQNVGAEKPARLAAAQAWIWRFALLWGVIAAAILIGFGGDIGRLFSDHPEIVQTTDLYLMLTAFGFIMAGVFQVGLGVLNPIGAPNLAAMMSAARHLVFFAGLAFLLSRGVVPGVDGVTGVFLAAPLSWLLAGAVSGTLIYWRLPRPGSADTRPAVSPAE